MWDQAMASIISGLVLAALVGLFQMPKHYPNAFARLWAWYFTWAFLMCIALAGISAGEWLGMSRLRYAAEQAGVDLSTVEAGNPLPLWIVGVMILGGGLILWFVRWLQESERAGPGGQ